MCIMNTHGNIQRCVSQKGGQNLGFYNILIKKAVSFQRSNKTKEKNFELLVTGKLWEGKYMGK